MPVVINEFEVVDTPAGEGARAPASAPAASPQRPDPEDLRRWLAELAELQLRLEAH
jgi:hypothetical protein